MLSLSRYANSVEGVTYFTQPHPLNQVLILQLVISVDVQMAEVHLIGQLKGASGFPDHSLFCKWKMDLG